MGKSVGKKEEYYGFDCPRCGEKKRSGIKTFSKTRITAVS